MFQVFLFMLTNLTLIVSEVSLRQVFNNQDYNATAELAVGLILFLVSQQLSIFKPPGT